MGAGEDWGGASGLGAGTTPGIPFAMGAGKDWCGVRLVSLLRVRDGLGDSGEAEARGGFKKREGKKRQRERGALGACWLLDEMCLGTPYGARFSPSSQV